MKAQLLVVVIFYSLIYCLLRLRHFYLASGDDVCNYCRAYIVGFEEIDGKLGEDNNLNGPNNESDANDGLGEWPTELELRPAAFATLHAIPAGGCTELSGTVAVTTKGDETL